MLVKRLDKFVYTAQFAWHEEIVRNPAWHAIESAIRELHPFHHPWIWLRLTDEEDDDDYMTVMGGDGLYWLAVTAGPHDQRRLFNVDRGSHEVPVWTSDQGFADYEFHTTDRIDDAIAAASYFCEHADCDPNLSWE